MARVQNSSTRGAPVARAEATVSLLECVEQEVVGRYRSGALLDAFRRRPGLFRRFWRRSEQFAGIDADSSINDAQRVVAEWREVCLEAVAFSDEQSNLAGALGGPV